LGTIKGWFGVLLSPSPLCASAEIRQIAERRGAVEKAQWLVLLGVSAST
jgi:hypothetical protein